MALKLNERYPGRANNPTAEYPQGSFKNRTAPGAQDGTYLEQDWTNDNLGFFSSLLSSAGAVANGLVDKVGASQYFDALISVIRGTSATETLRGSSKIATQAETDAGTLDNAVVTPKKLRFGLSYSLSGGNGYIRLPSWVGGVTFQWMQITISTASQTFSYPVSFVQYAKAIIPARTAGSNEPAASLSISFGTATPGGVPIYRASDIGTYGPATFWIFAVGV